MGDNAAYQTRKYRGGFLTSNPYGIFHVDLVFCQKRKALYWTLTILTYALLIAATFFSLAKIERSTWPVQETNDAKRYGKFLFLSDMLEFFPRNIKNQNNAYFYGRTSGLLTLPRAALMIIGSEDINIYEEKYRSSAIDSEVDLASLLEAIGKDLGIVITGEFEILLQEEAEFAPGLGIFGSSSTRKGTRGSGILIDHENEIVIFFKTYTLSLTPKDNSHIPQ